MADFEMPRDLSRDPPRVPGYEPPQPIRQASEFAKRPVVSPKLMETLERELTPSPWKDDHLIEDIKGLIKKLTHRQMREMCEAICAKSDTITKADLPEVLDRFAYGD